MSEKDLAIHINGIHCCSKCLKTLDGDWVRYYSFYYCKECYFEILKKETNEQQ